MTFVALMALGGIVALDASSFGQLMLSRPLVAGTLAGALVGLPLEGALLGAVLETLTLDILPVGAARYPESGTAVVAAVGTLGLAEVAVGPPVLLITLVYALGWQRVAGATVVGGRYLNERMVRAGRPGPPEMDRLIEHRHIETMLLDVVRGLGVTAVGLLLGMPLLRLAAEYWSLPAPAAGVAVSTAAAAALAGAVALFGETPRARLFLIAGLACGSILLIAP